MIPSDFSIIHLENEFSFMYDIPGLPVSQALLCHIEKYALWLDFRTIEDNRLHGSGRRLENTSEGIHLQITKEAGASGKLSCYLYIFQDAQINISDAQFLNVVY